MRSYLELTDDETNSYYDEMTDEFIYSLKDFCNEYFSTLVDIKDGYIKELFDNKLLEERDIIEELNNILSDDVMDNLFTDFGYPYKSNDRLKGLDLDYGKFRFALGEVNEIERGVYNILVELNYDYTIVVWKGQININLLVEKGVIKMGVMYKELFYKRAEQDDIRNAIKEFRENERLLATGQKNYKASIEEAEALIIKMKSVFNISELQKDMDTSKENLIELLNTVESRSYRFDQLLYKIETLPPARISPDYKNIVALLSKVSLEIKHLADMFIENSKNEKRQKERYELTVNPFIIARKGIVISGSLWNDFVNWVCSIYDNVIDTVKGFLGNYDKAIEELEVLVNKLEE